MNHSCIKGLIINEQVRNELLLIGKKPPNIIPVAIHRLNKSFFLISEELKMHNFPVKQEAEGSGGHVPAAQGVCNWSFGRVWTHYKTHGEVSCHTSRIYNVIGTWEDEKLSAMVWMLSVIPLCTAARVVLKQ